MAVTIKEVAALAGVSPSTVSRTCKNNPSISEETKERVRKAMLQLGYEPNFQASTLASQSSNSRCIGIILPASAKEAYENSFLSGNHPGNQPLLQQPPVYQHHYNRTE